MLKLALLQNATTHPHSTTVIYGHIFANLIDINNKKSVRCALRSFSMQHKDLETIKITVEGKEIDFLLARCLSEDMALTIVAEPMLIAWFDGKKSRRTSGGSRVSAQAWVDSVCGRSWRSSTC
jgi:hypothetical protein